MHDAFGDAEGGDEVAQGIEIAAAADDEELVVGRELGDGSDEDVEALLPDDTAAETDNGVIGHVEFMAERGGVGRAENTTINLGVDDARALDREAKGGKRPDCAVGCAGGEIKVLEYGALGTAAEPFELAAPVARDVLKDEDAEAGLRDEAADHEQGLGGGELGGLSDVEGDFRLGVADDSAEG